MSMERRSFLKALGGATMAGTLGGYTAALAEVAGQGPAAAFGFADDKVPMNAANLCPMPSAISAAVARFAGELDVDMSDANRHRIEAFKNDARTGIARQLGVRPEEIAIVRNTSEANNIFVQGMSLEPGDEVLLWDQNHPSNGVAWEVRSRRSGCSVRYFSVPPDAGSIDEVVDIVLGELGERTRVLSFTHISNISGFRLPAAEICAAARRKSDRLHLHVDGAQTWGIRDVNLADIGCDTFSGSAHKWYLGPREVGMLFVREAAQPHVWPGVVSVPWGSTVDPEVPGARKFEALGQRDDAAIAALAETVRFHDGLTPAAMERHSTAIADRLREGLLELGVPFVSTVNPAFTSNVIVLAAARESRRLLLDNILRDGGIILAGVNGLRLSPHLYNTPEHVDRAVAAVAKSRDLLG